MTAAEQGIETTPGPKGRKWIAVDLDGTLAIYDKWRGRDHIGEPVPEMAERVKGWLAEGHVVVIFTGRVCDPEKPDHREVYAAIHAWCERHLGKRLFVTATKWNYISEFWDDRAYRVEKNTGALV